ncbi:uncharacterized protein LOC135074751 [Ostrinia nubilalis]|uniref:uncharacterized protein LOC114362656 n=1 Tax=Ostrinia furnacalis TaxID=93504 RepID=UPI00103BD7F7|nr:uncharacterized protein LOC114362656 [Ostrinia furnacalis]
MVLADFLTETRRRWLKAFKLFKRSRSRKGTRNRVSPALVRSPSYSGTVDARSEIDLQRFCACRASLPPLSLAQESFENTSYYSSYNSYSSRNESEDSNFDGARSDSAYDSARSSPSNHRAPVCYATVTYFNVNDSEDSSSIRTEYTLLDYEADDDEPEDERTQNMINESIELVSTL